MKSTNPPPDPFRRPTILPAPWVPEVVEVQFPPRPLRDFDDEPPTRPDIPRPPRLPNVQY